MCYNFDMTSLLLILCALTQGFCIYASQLEERLEASLTKIRTSSKNTTKSCGCNKQDSCYCAQWQAYWAEKIAIAQKRQETWNNIVRQDLKARAFEEVQGTTTLQDLEARIFEDVQDKPCHCKGCLLGRFFKQVHEDIALENQQHALKSYNQWKSDWEKVHGYSPDEQRCKKWQVFLEQETADIDNTEKCFCYDCLCQRFSEQH